VTCVNLTWNDSLVFHQDVIDEVGVVLMRFIYLNTYFAGFVKVKLFEGVRVLAFGSQM
jgi:hypothetical protein